MSISLKVNIIMQLDVTLQHISHYAMGNLPIYIYIFFLYHPIGQVGRVFAKGLRDQGSMPG